MLVWMVFLISHMESLSDSGGFNKIIWKYQVLSSHDLHKCKLSRLP